MEQHIKIQTDIKIWSQFKESVTITLQQGFSTQQLINYITLIEREKTYTTSQVN